MATNRSESDNCKSSKTLTSALKKRLTTCLHWCRCCASRQQHFLQDNAIYNKTNKKLRKLKNIWKLQKSTTESDKSKTRECAATSAVEAVVPIATITTTATASVQRIATTRGADIVLNNNNNNYQDDSGIDSDSDSECESNNKTIIMSHCSTFICIRTKHPTIDLDVRSILMLHAQNGASIQQIQADYQQTMGQPFPVQNNITDFLLSIPLVTACCNEYGQLTFNIMPSERNRHLHNLIREQRPKSSNNYADRSTCHNCNVWQNIDCRNDLQKPISTPGDSIDAGEIGLQNELYARALRNNIDNSEKVNNFDRPKKCTIEQAARHEINKNRICQGLDERLKPQIERLPTNAESNSDNNSSDAYEDGAQWLGFLFMGDDFFLNLARMELRCKLKKKDGILTSGLCISGQTIYAAYRRIRRLPPDHTQQSVIINLGSVDLMRGITLVKMEFYYQQLIKELLRRNWKPIVTTLAPLANMAYETSMKEKLKKFNNFLMRQQWSHKLTVLDINECLVNELNEIRFDCYQSSPRFVTGTRQAFVLWNKIGHHRVLQLIGQHIED